MTDPLPPGRRFRLPLTYQILLGLVIGALIGVLDPGDAVSLQVISDIFLRMIRMVVAPLVITTLVTGIAGTGPKLVGRLGLKAITWFLLATAVALVIGVIAANLVQPGVGYVPVGDASKVSQLAHAKTATEFLRDAFPTSIVDAMASNNLLQIVVFSVFFGLAVSAAGARAQPIKQLCEAGAEVMFRMVGFVMRFAPFGVGAAIAVTLGKNGPEVLLNLLKCVAALYAALIVFFALLFAVMKLVTRVHMSTFLAAIREPALIAFTTSTSEAALPRSMQVLEQLGVPRRIVGLVVPTGYAFNLDGSALYLSLALMFVAQAVGLHMTWTQQLQAMAVLMIASKGVAGVPRAALVVLLGTAPSLGLPEHSTMATIATLMGIDAVMDMGRTCVNVVGNCVATVVVASWEKAIPPDAPIYRPRAALASLPEARALFDGELDAAPSGESGGGH